MAETYRIEDEPIPGRLAYVAVNPVWPLFGFMFAGTWIAWPWHILNAFAIGSSSRFRELGLAILGFCGSIVLSLGILYLAKRETLQGSGIEYALLGLTLWKLGVSYSLYTMQVRSFEIYQHYEEIVRNGVVVVVIAYFLSHRLVLKLFPADLWYLIMR